MAVVATIDERNGAPAGVEETGVANINQGSNDSFEIVPATYPIVAGENGFEKWLKIAFATVSNKVDNGQTWISTGTLHLEADLKTNCRESTYGGNETYAQPTDTTSSVADQDYAEADPTGANYGFAGSLTGNITSDGQSDYIVMQLQTTASMPGGNITQLTITFQWDEQ